MRNRTGEIQYSRDDDPAEQMTCLLNETFFVACTAVFTLALVVAVGSVELHLGMAEDLVLAKLAKAGYKVSGVAGSDEWVVAEQTDRFPFQPLGDVSFKNKTLVFINRTWTPDADTAANIGEGLYGVMSNLSKNGRKYFRRASCSIA
jgi:hypothetical protein